MDDRQSLMGIMPTDRADLVMLGFFVVEHRKRLQAEMARSG
jgi:hypothetical protein